MRSRSIIVARGMTPTEAYTAPRTLNMRGTVGMALQAIYIVDTPFAEIRNRGAA